MRRRALLLSISIVGMTTGFGCNLIAGLGDFQPPSTASTGAAGGASGGAGGSGGDGTATSGSSMTTSSTHASSSSTGTGMQVCANHLLINEVRVQGSDFVELYNPTNAPIGLTGMQLFARTSGSSLGLKWSAQGGATVGAHSFYTLATNGTGDDSLSANIVSDDPTVVVLEDSNFDVVDSLCVCSAASPCSFIDGALDYCAGRALLSAQLHVSGDTHSAQRSTCGDTDHDGTDFELACPTPGAPNLTVPTCP